MHQRLARTAAATLSAAALALGAATAPANADGAPSPYDDLSPRTEFTMQPDGSSGNTTDGSTIPNIDSVKSTIRTYYNAPASGPDAGIADKQHSPYISEMESIEQDQWRYLRRTMRQWRHHHGRHTAKPAVVFDADDTTLWTYDMEDKAMGFNFDPTLQNTWVQDQRFPASPGMVHFVNKVRRMGFKVFGITGRSDTQEKATLGNLRKVGYRPFNARNFYTKWSGSNPQPSYVTCAAAKCTTVEYKAGTRQHIEKMGYDIALNVGDQWSDLQGGHADRVLKLPNPTYFLPSPDLDGTPAEPDFSPRTHFTMQPDGSSGATQGGEGIPNVDIVKSTIRTYYNAPSSGSGAGIADKDSSPYIHEMQALAASRATALTDECAAKKGDEHPPAIVFDADDTTLWTYDMEDGDMHFVFDPKKQNDDWVQPKKFPATPGMVDLVNAVADAGCTVIGLTGRHDDQKDATLGNLDKVGYEPFTGELYFTKWDSGAKPPAYTLGTPCGDGSCSTIEYKSAVRQHVEDDLGYDVIANFGDQFSDLIGGHADQTVKLPNPTYYLP